MIKRWGPSPLGFRRLGPPSLPPPLLHAGCCHSLLPAEMQTVHPIKHGHLWKLTKTMMIKKWLSRWFFLDRSGFYYAASPQVRMQVSAP